MAGISSTEASRLLNRMIDRIDFLGDNLLQSVNPTQRTASQDHIGQVFARFANGRSVHLELGVWTAWPEERVQQHVGPDKLGDIIRLDMNPAFSGRCRREHHGAALPGQLDRLHLVEQPVRACTLPS